MSTATSARLAALEVLVEVVVRGRRLDPDDGRLTRLASARDRALARELAFGVVRWLPRLDAILDELLERPLRARDRDVGLAAALGLYQLLHTRVAPHAAVAEAVALTQARDKRWASGLVNALLRRFQRERDTLLARADRQPVSAFAHPAWLIDRLRAAWPGHWRDVLAANNERAPMTLRVNLRRGTREAYLARLAAAGIEARATGVSPAGVVLAAPCDVTMLPGFDTGCVSVQDEAAQLACGLLGATGNHRVLDACAAPGGKAAHIIEATEPPPTVLAVDVDPAGARRVEAALARLGLAGSVITGDATRPSGWWDGQPFDRILLDAPCTATGVIRRHPDIKLHRREADATALADTQLDLLAGTWALLARGGLLLYATCSVLPQENDQVIDRFLAAHPEADCTVIDAAWGSPTSRGRQILPGEQGMDGFFYALLRKPE